MKIDKLLNHNFPNGEHVIAALSNKTLRTKKAQTFLQAFPSGRARTRSLYSSIHVVVLEKDLPINIKAICRQKITIN